MFVEEKKLGEARVLEPWRQYLLDAANILERDGWCQSVCLNKRGERCIMGALGAVYHSSMLDWPQQAIHALNINLQGPIASWNDKSGRTKEEVLAMLRDTALNGTDIAI